MEQFGDNGDGYPAILSRLRSGNAMWGGALRNYGATYGLIMEWQNSTGYNTIEEIRASIIALIQTLKGLGIIPILTTEWRASSWPAFSTVDRAAFFANIADETGAYFVDMTATEYLFKAAADRAGDYNGVHPGVRTNELIRGPVEDFITKVLGSPARRMKIARRRSGYAVASLDDLVFRTKEEFATRFQPLRVGESALTTSQNSEYVDQVNSGSASYSDYVSEVQTLIEGGTVAYSDYLLIDAKIDMSPSAVDSVTLSVSDTSASLYMLDALATPYESPARYQAFNMASTAGFVAGAKYTSNDPAIPGTFNVVGAWNGALQFDFIAPGLVGGSGALTKVSGSGPSTFAYTSTNPSNEAAFYTYLGKPKGHWVAVPGAGGIFTIDRALLKSRWNDDSLLFLLYNPAGGTIGMPTVTYTGQPGKARRPLPSSGRSARGAELLAQPLCHTLTGWTVTAGSPTVSNLSSDDGQLPRGTTGVMLMPNGSKIFQSFSYAAFDDEAREVEITIWPRYSPPRYTPNSGTPPITENSLDFNLWEISLISSGSEAGEKRLTRVVRGDLWWRKKTFRTRLMPGSTIRGIEVGPVGGNAQLAKVSVRFVDA